MRECLICVSVERLEVGERIDIEIGRDIIDDIDFKDLEIGVIIADYERSLGREWVVSKIYRLKERIRGEVEGLEDIVREVEDLQVIALAEIDRLDISTLREEVIDKRGVTIHFDLLAFTQRNGDDSRNDSLIFFAPERGMYIVGDGSIATIYFDLSFFGSGYLEAERRSSAVGFKTDGKLIVGESGA